MYIHVHEYTSSNQYTCLSLSFVLIYCILCARRAWIVPTKRVPFVTVLQSRLAFSGGNDLYGDFLVINW